MTPDVGGFFVLMLWKCCSTFLFLSLFAGLKKSSGWDAGAFSFGSFWKILSEGVEEDGVGRFTGNPISQESQDHSRMEKDTQRDSKMSQCCQIAGREFGKFLQECCPGAGDGGDPSRLPCARYCCR